MFVEEIFRSRLWHRLLFKMSGSIPQFMNKKPVAIHWQILGGAAFLIIPLLVAPRPPDMPFFSLPTMRDFLASCFMLIIFYLNFYILIPFLYFRNRHILYALTVIAGLVVISLVPSLLTGYVPWDLPKHPEIGLFKDHESEPVPLMRSDASFLVQVAHNIFLYSAVILFSLLLRVQVKLLKTELLKHNAELGTLKNQINPHFLFNTLNNIYAFAIREKAPNTSSSILKLSGMMRYVVTETSKEFVALDKEISYTNDYIELQKMRLTKTLHLSYNVTGFIGNQTIAPLILMPFIENAFKHGVNPDEESYIGINISVSENVLTMNVDNQKVKVAPELHAKSGVGIANTKARLELLYPKKYCLSINEDSSHYRVQLTIELE
jgi:hypothetical protein